MPSRTKHKNAEIAARSAAHPQEADGPVCGPMTGEEVNAATLALKKALIERVMGAELSHHLGQADAEAANHRNGTSAKTVITGEGPVRVDIPRDRAGSFAPILIPKHERRFTGFDDKIIAMYEVDPFSRTPYRFERRSPTCPSPSRPTRRSFVNSSSNWLVPAARQRNLSREFGVSAQSITNWIAQHARNRGKALPGKEGLKSAEREELVRLRRKLRQVEQERDILVKATAWFAA